MAHVPGSRRLSIRVAFGVGAFLLADLIVGLAAFCVITLAALWYFSVGWIRLVHTFQNEGVVFGSSTQLGLAVFGATVALPALVVTVYLAIRASSLPRTLYRFGRRTAPTPPVSRFRG